LSYKDYQPRALSFELFDQHPAPSNQKPATRNQKPATSKEKEDDKELECFA
jgi:hypothetical protein